MNPRPCKILSSKAHTNHCFCRMKLKTTKTDKQSISYFHQQQNMKKLQFVKFVHC